MSNSPEHREHSASRGVARVWVVSAAAAASLFTAGAVLAPVLAGPAGGLLRLFYAPLCHQLSGRCLTLADAPMAACARCVGLYAGGALGLLAFGLLARGALRLRPVWLAVALAPTALDAASGWLGLPALLNLPRFALAVPTGLVLGLLLGHGISDLVLMIRQRNTKTLSEPTSSGTISDPV